MLSMKFYNPGPDGLHREGPRIYPKTITAHVSLWRCRFRGQQKEGTFYSYFHVGLNLKVE